MLDPTRDQFEEDPFWEEAAGEYRRADAKPASEMEYEASMQLRVQWATNRRRREAISKVAALYALDLVPIEEPLGLLTQVSR